jgi:hypothetical protein
MKVLINTITNTEIWAIREQQEKDGVRPEDLFTGVYEIEGELFIPGEWKHVADDFDTKEYPKIKPVETHLQERVKQVLEENGLNSFTQGVKEAAEMYAKAVPAVATDVAKYAPYVPAVVIGPGVIGGGS